MFRIGDFARICQVTTKTLRYYDEIGLAEARLHRPVYRLPLLHH